MHSHHLKRIIGTLIIMVVFTGCTGDNSPTPTAVPPTANVPSATSTPVPPTATPIPPVGQVYRETDMVEHGATTDALSPIQDAVAFYTGDALRVRDGGEGVLDFSDGLSLRVFNDTALGIVSVASLPDASLETRLFLEEGGFTGELVKSGNQAVFETPGGAEIQILGTEYFVVYDPVNTRATVANFGGSVVLATNGVTTSLQSGFLTRIPDGREPGPQFRLPAERSAFEARARELQSPVKAADELFDQASLKKLDETIERHTTTSLPDGSLLIVGGQNCSDKAYATTWHYDPQTAAWTSVGDLNTPRAWHATAPLPDGGVLVTGGWDALPGEESMTSYSSVERYDPDTQSWSKVAAMHSKRIAHTATPLTDGRVLVVGGAGATSKEEFFTAEIYDPATDTWMPTSNANFWRMEHTATRLSDGRVLVSGGYGSAASPNGEYENFELLRSAEVYDPDMDTWTVVGEMETVRVWHSATLLPDGRVLVVGGGTDSWFVNEDSESEVYAAAEIYDPDIETWRRTADLTYARDAHQATLLPDGTVLVTGGSNDSGQGQEDDQVMVVERYDPISETWTEAGSLTVGRVVHTANLLPDGKVLVMGGSGIGYALHSQELYNPETGRWLATPWNAPRSLAGAALLPDGHILFAGGANQAGALKLTELYSPTTHSWRTVGNLNEARYEYTTIQLQDERLLAVGGIRYQDDFIYLDSAELYDPETETWTLTGSLGQPRFRHTATLLPDGRVLVTGGWLGDRQYLNTAELYDPQTGIWTRTGSMRVTRAHHTATLLNNGLVLVAGGLDYTGHHDSAELFNPQTGQWTSAGTMARPHYKHSATLLPDGRVLIVGGAIGWRGVEIYDPDTNTWSDVTQTDEPHYDHTATLLTDGTVMVVGGQDEPIDTVEIYDPKRDVWVTHQSLHTRRSDHTALLLSDGRVLVFGGYDGTFYLDSVEIYDPKTGDWEIPEGL